MQIESVVEVEHLTAGYDGVKVLENINFHVDKGEIFVVLGGSGCGKSTLLKHLTGLMEPMHGDVKIYDRSIVNLHSPEEKRKIMRSFGVLYQSGALFGSLTVGENISLLLEEYTDLTKAETKEKVCEKLQMVKLDGFEDYMPSELSGGMRKRASLARAMALDPKLLFFDEPSAGLDPISSAQLDELILKLRENLNTTMVIVTHELDSVFTISDRVIVLDEKNKGIVAEGDPEKLRMDSGNISVKNFLNRNGLKRKV